MTTEQPSFDGSADMFDEVVLMGAPIMPIRGASDPFQLRLMNAPGPDPSLNDEIAYVSGGTSDDESSAFGSHHSEDHANAIVGPLPPSPSARLGSVIVSHMTDEDPGCRKREPCDGTTSMSMPVALPLLQHRQTTGSSFCSDGSSVSPANVGTIGAAHGARNVVRAADTSQNSSPVVVGASAPDARATSRARRTRQPKSDDEEEEESDCIGTKRTRRTSRRVCRTRNTTVKEEKEEFPEDKDDDDDDNEDLSGLSKRDRNKRSAARYRKRRKMYMGTLERKVSELTDTLRQQQQDMASMEMERNVMAEQVAFLKRLLESSGVQIPTTTQTGATTTGRKGARVGRSIRMDRATSGVLFAVFACFLLAGPLTLPSENARTMLLSSTLPPTKESSIMDPPMIRRGGGRMLTAVNFVPEHQLEDGGPNDLPSASPHSLHVLEHILQSARSTTSPFLREEAGNSSGPHAHRFSGSWADVVVA